MEAIGQAGRTERLIEGLPNKPFLAGEEGVSMSLAGVQTKLAVAIDDAGRVCVPINGSPSTHILKPDSPRLRGGVQNEAFCLALARRLKIPTPNFTTGRAGKRSYLLVQRYDRTVLAAVGVACTRRTIVKRLGDHHPPSTSLTRPEFPARH